MSRSLICRQVLDFEPYCPGLSIEEIKERYGLLSVIKLASNENPLGASPMVLHALERQLTEVHRYPRAGSPRLRQALGAYHGVPEDRIVAGNGSDDLIDLLIRVAVEPGRAGRVEQALKRAYLWEEVKDRLTESALLLSGGQQQRLCIARALILEPEILLLDEPTSSLDAKAAAVIESLLVSLKENCTLLIVSHYQDQVKRIADTIFELTAGILALSSTPA